MHQGLLIKRGKRSASFTPSDNIRSHEHTVTTGSQQNHVTHVENHRSEANVTETTPRASGLALTRLKACKTRGPELISGTHIRGGSQKLSSNLCTRAQTQTPIIHVHTHTTHPSYIHTPIIHAHTSYTRAHTHTQHTHTHHTRTHTHIQNNPLHYSSLSVIFPKSVFFLTYAGEKTWGRLLLLSSFR